jgi:hypothetical protein
MYLLQCGKSLIITTQTAKAPQKQQQRCNMSDVWDTKDGRRRVRRDPPTLEDAVLAAQGLAEDVDGQVEIVTSLMRVSAEEARRAVLKMGQPKDTDRFTTAGRGGAPRTVVVERRAPRRVPSSRPTASAGYRGRI